MPLSRYLKIYPDPDRPGSYLLYSTRKGSLIRASASLLSAARENRLTDAQLATFVRLEMFVADPASECEAMSSLVRRANSRSSKYRATVVLNLDCNLDCPYCYEGGFRDKKYMSTDTAHLFVDTVIREQIACNRDVEIQFYGGEPLLSVPLLREIARPLQAAALQQGVGFSFGLTTNGTLLTRAVVEELLPLGLIRAILTLDGPAEIHDSQRPFVSGKGSFAIIIANIKATWDLLDLQLGGNFSSDNYREFPRLLDTLLDERITPEMVGMIQFAPITPRSGQRVGADSATGCVSGSEPWATAAAVFLREETLKRGFTTFKPTMAVCMIEFDNDIVVNYDGSLYKCAAFMGWPELSVGSLAEGINDYRISHNLAVWHKDECIDCAYLPLCFGGCRLNPLLQNGSINDVDCRREFYDVALEQFILQDLHYRKNV